MSDNYEYMFVEPETRINQLLHTARFLRKARRMQQECMLRWALDSASKLRSREDQQTIEIPISHNDPFADPMNRDWHLLYRGNILDD